VAHGEWRACVAQAEAKSSKSFLVLFFKKEQKERTSFLKKRSKKLFSIGFGVAMAGRGLCAGNHWERKTFLRCPRHSLVARVGIYGVRFMINER
jgi:hypothetical protein